MASRIREIKDSAGLMDVCKEGKPVVLKVYATWCGSCTRIAPRFEELANQTTEGVNFVSIDYDSDEPFIKDMLKVELLPSFLAFNGPKIIERSAGSAEEGIQSVLKAASDAASGAPSEAAAPAAEEKEAPAPAAEPAAEQAAEPATATTTTHTGSARVRHVVGSEGLMDVCKEGKPVVVKVFATWCGSCTRVAPRVEELANETTDAVNFVQMDYDEDEPFIKDVLKVELLPSFIAFNGPKIVERSAGSDEEGIKKVIKAAVDATA